MLPDWNHFNFKFSNMYWKLSDVKSARNTIVSSTPEAETLGLKLNVGFKWSSATSVLT